MNKDELIIRVKSDGTVTLDAYDDGGIITHKNISAEGFMNALKSSVRTEVIFKSGLLPENCIHVLETQTTRYFVLDCKERYADISYYKTEYKHFPLPRLLYGFYLNKDNKVIGVNLGVVQDKVRLSEDTKMYFYPFSNVSGFHMCIGANSIPPLKTLHALSNIPHYLNSMPNNDDHYNTRYNSFGYEYRELLESLKDKTPEFYYTDVLVENGMTLKSFL